MTSSLPITNLVQQTLQVPPLITFKFGTSQNQVVFRIQVESLENCDIGEGMLMWLVPEAVKVLTFTTQQQWQQCFIVEFVLILQIQAAISAN